LETTKDANHRPWTTGNGLVDAFTAGDTQKCIDGFVQGDTEVKKRLRLEGAGFSHLCCIEMLENDLSEPSFETTTLLCFVLTL
jgi:hypothetical protein